MPRILTLPWPPRACSPNRSRAGNWRARTTAAKAYKRDCFVLALAGGWNAAAGKCLGDSALMLRLEFIQPNRIRRDDDNLIAAFKSGRDAVAQALAIDDARFSLQVHMLPPDPLLRDPMGRKGVVRASIEVLP